MKTIITYIFLLITTFVNTIAFSQQNASLTREERKIQIENTKNETIEEIKQNEKNKLKREVRYINYLVSEGRLSEDEGEKRKKNSARRVAENIKNRITIAENEAELLIREQPDTTEVNGSYVMFWKFAEDGKIADFTLKKRINNDELREPDSKRTVSDLVLAFGFNNALVDRQSINDSDFKLAGSRFFEIGWAWKTRVFEKTNWLRFRYGLSFQFNGLKPTDNRYFIQDGKETFLSEFEYDLDKSKFRMDNLVVPVHFEIGPSTRNEYEDKVRFSTAGKLKVGLGGYAGFNIGERQKLKYEIEGDKQKDKLKAGYNTNDLVYGLSSYISFGGTAIYAKYDLNPIFQSPNTKLYNFSLGLRFDVD